MIYWFLLVPAQVPGLVSLLSFPFFFTKKKTLELNGVQNSCQKRSLFHHDVLVPLGSGSGSGACLPFFSLLSLLPKGVLFHHDVLALRGSGSGSGACLPSAFFLLFSGSGVCSIMVLVPPGSGWGSGACLPSAIFLLFSGVISWFFLVPAGVPVLVSLLLSSFFSSERGLCSIMMSWFLLVPARVQVLVSLLSLLLPSCFSFCPQKWSSVPS